MSGNNAKYIRCDHFGCGAVYDRAPKSYDPNNGALLDGSTLRKLALIEGWATARAFSGWAHLDIDFCPAHAPHVTTPQPR